MPNATDDTDDNMESAEKRKQDTWTTQTRRYDYGGWEEDMGDKYLTTWTSPGGKTRRQIGFITINAKYRNTAQKAHIGIYCHANVNQNQQRRVQTMQLYYNAAKKYKTPTPPDDGRVIKYDLRELRLRPEKRAKGYQEQEKNKGKHRMKMR